MMIIVLKIYSGILSCNEFLSLTFISRRSAVVGKRNRIEQEEVMPTADPRAKTSPGSLSVGLGHIEWAGAFNARSGHSCVSELFFV